MPAASNSNGQPGERPNFALVLGLLPPYSLEDVKRAYLAKVKDAHPDRGGERAEFDRVQQAYEQANEYLSFRGDRRQWIAARMEEYIAVESLIARLRELGAEVKTTTHDWVKRSFGEFAGLTESIAVVRVERAQSAAELIELLTRERTNLAGLRRLALSDCDITDALALQLRVHTGLTHLDLSGNPVTSRVALALADWLPQLREFHLSGTRAGWLSRVRLRHRLSRQRSTHLPAVLHPVNIR
jgi:hypothetical protein